jgi:hypothetical protein
VTVTSRADTAMVCAVLLGEPPPRHLTPDAFDALWRTAVEHRVDLLIAATLPYEATELSAEARRALDEHRAQADVRDLLRHRELCRLVEAFVRHGVPMLILKGAGLAYLVYADTALRPALDMDLWARRADLDAAEAALVDCGYRRLTEPDTEVASTQRHYGRHDGLGQRHVVDLHWRVANPEVFADVLTFDEAWPRALPIDALGPAARTLDLPDALLLACVHRVAHHHDEGLLLWLWDIHLLVSHLDEARLLRVVERARHHRVSSVVAHSLARARECFGTAVPDTVMDALRQATPPEPSAQFLDAPSLATELRSSLVALDSWSDRWRLLREHLLPPRAYMRAKYATWPGPLLPVAYLHRAVRGAPRWFKRRML